MHFTRLRLHGFKSFVDSTDLLIAEGLTGIVGPNGCGKSNLVEALRWVMGETSARRMRGTGMEDVIFAGTTTRPSRNMAEVTLTLDNQDRTASAEFNDADSLDVTRRIERGGGSDYRVNGKPVRQRDVQILFADQATGAHSTSVVGQGQIDALIRAKPQDRRQILEEASGTAGLQARRHEAELKLKGAEQNLTRVDDVLKAQDTQLRSLKQQVRQASRYRNLAEHIRRTEAALLHLRWEEAGQGADTAQESLRQADAEVQERTLVTTRRATEHANAAAELPALRQAETSAAAALQKLVIAREQLDSEARRIEGELRGLEQRLTQTRQDQERESARLRDSESASAALASEQETRQAEAARLEAESPGAESLLQAVTADVEALDADLAQRLEAVASVESRRGALEKERDSLARRLADMEARRATLERQETEAKAALAGQPDATLASSMVEACENELAKRQQQAGEAETALREAESVHASRRETAQNARSAVTRLKAEADAIEALLRPHDDTADQALDRIVVAPGFENALAVALGEALTGAVESPEAPRHWRHFPAYDDAPALPEGAAPLAERLEAPPHMARCLAQIGLVPDAAAGAALASGLRPGQMLVTQEGWAWRWDGYTVTPQATTATAARLQQKNRLAQLRESLRDAESAALEAENVLQEAAGLLKQCQTLDQQARASLQAAFSALNDARALHARQEREAAAMNSRLVALAESRRHLDADQQPVQERAAAVESEIADLPPVEGLRQEIANQRLVLSEKRAAQAHQRSERDRLSREAAACGNRRTAIARELEAWRERGAAAARHVEELTVRTAELESQREALAQRPAELAAERARLLDDLGAAEAMRSAAADRLIAAEQNVALLERALKQDEAAQAHAREERIRAEAALQAAAEHQVGLRERIAEKLSCEPDALRELAAYADGEAWPSAFELEQALGRYLREREAMGPVNLRAEMEAETLQQAMGQLETEKADLVEAIAKLRQGIAQLNREARERLQNAFGLVNERFQVLFQRLFNGGKAYLELVDNEDPLNAGLEIFASPPGKKLQVLSLLSGGERTLTALALLFAVFQTNPSPICVLDEAEAALDESNIGRFCGLVESIARETGTRFLIITHQRLTMARMDRLFGVTMGEKGVSQLVSVDLANAVALRDGAAAPSPEAVQQAAEALADVQAA